MSGDDFYRAFMRKHAAETRDHMRFVMLLASLGASFSILLIAFLLVVHGQQVCP